MEVLSKEMILLTNVEVQLALENTPALAKFPPIEEFMHVIEERKSESDIDPAGETAKWEDYGTDELVGLQHAAYIKEKVQLYLKKQPSSVQTTNDISSFIQKVGEVLGSTTLTKGELVQLVNLRPITMPELYNVIDQCEERLDEDQSTLLLEIIETYLPEFQYEKIPEDEDEEQEQGGHIDIPDSDSD